MSQGSRSVAGPPKTQEFGYAVSASLPNVIYMEITFYARNLMKFKTITKLFEPLCLFYFFVVKSRPGTDLSGGPMDYINV